MRTNIVIEDELMAKAMKATGLKTKRETVEVALERLVDLDAQREFRGLRGKIKWVGDLDAMRRD